MSDETPSTPENTPTPKAAPAPRARRISTPRPKKVAKEAVAAEAATVVEPAPPAAPGVVSIPFPSAPRREELPEAPAQGGNDWPEPEAESGGGNASLSESSKRKRRRRKGKGQSSSAPQAGNPPNEDLQSAAIGDSKPADAPREQGPRPNPQPQQAPQPRVKIDPEHLAKMAWKIYLAEVSEEGVALIGDNDAKDLSRRCFRLAEIFIEEQSRRR